MRHCGRFECKDTGGLDLRPLLIAWRLVFNACHGDGGIARGFGTFGRLFDLDVVSGRIRRRGRIAGLCWCLPLRSKRSREICVNSALKCLGGLGP